ncbi:MAG: FAD-dependent oxidoreductase [Actinoplanes sp.]
MTEHRILILGAGYAGMSATATLAGRTKNRHDVRITLVNAEPTFTERLRLHQTATGQRTADLKIPDLLAGTGVELVTGRVTAIDATAHSVRVGDDTLGYDTLGYDTLVIGLGGTADPVDHTYTLDSRPRAAALAARLDELAGLAGLAGPNGGSVVVCGSGLTGVEAAAEIAERYPALTVTLVGRTEPGASLHPRAGAHLRAVLDRLGVRVRAGSEVIKVRPDSVDLADGTGIPADAVLWTAGVRASRLATDAGLTVDDHGRVVVDAALRSVSHPDVYAVGDAAAVRQAYGMLHGTCQSGMPTGVHAANSIARELSGRAARPFRFGYYHVPVSLGRRDAVIQFTRPDDSPRRWRLTGRAAVWYKETVSSAPWPTFRRMTTSPRVASIWPRGGRATR